MERWKSCWHSLFGRFNTYNAVSCSPSDAFVRSSADALASQGYVAAGKFAVSKWRTDSHYVRAHLTICHFLFPQQDTNFSSSIVDTKPPLVTPLVSWPTILLGSQMESKRLQITPGLKDWNGRWWVPLKSVDLPRGLGLTQHTLSAPFTVQWRWSQILWHYEHSSPGLFRQRKDRRPVLSREWSWTSQIWQVSFHLLSVDFFLEPSLIDALPFSFSPSAATSPQTTTLQRMQMDPS